MKITLESTTQITQIDGVAARVWEGVTDTGIKIICLITAISVSEDESEATLQQFQNELQQIKPPTTGLYTLSLIL